MTPLINEVKNVILIVLGILSAAMGLKGFLLSSHFIDGGVTGVSMLLAQIMGIPLAIAGLSLCLAFMSFPDVTSDKLLTAVFGGLFIGAGIGLAIRGGAVLDGTEIAALLVSRKSHLLKVGDIILILNIFIFMTAMFLLGVEIALYSILTYIAASKTIDFILHGIEEYTAITIISNEYEAIKEAITNRLHRGVTVYKGSGGLGSRGAVNEERDILYCVVTRLEIGMIKRVIKELDPNAFVTTHSLSEVDGGLIKRAALH